MFDLERLIVPYSLWLALGACTAVNAQLTIPEVDGSQEVKVLDAGMGDRVPECTLVTRVEIVDGRVARDDSAFEGTYDRAVKNLRNTAVSHDAQVAYIANILDSIVFDSPESRGAEITLIADLYHCPTDYDSAG